MAFSEGQKLDNNRYVIKKELGRGGFGITYLAKNKHQEEVVIKTMTDEVQRSPDFARSQQDFLNEALKLAKCDHPHVVQVERVFQEGALWCIVMEYIAGENLASFIMNRGVLPEAEALLYVNQIGAALKVAHSKSLLHRDVTPNNIMLRTRRGGKPCTPEAVLIDFGLARKFIPNQLNSHTAVVTSGYAPIEQYFRRQTPGEYSDVYALAATLYVLLTKALPESALDRAEEIRTRKSDPLVPPKRINPNISDKVNLAILKGMAFEATQRPQSVRQWLALLEVENNKSLRNVDSEAPTIRIPGVSPLPKVANSLLPQTPLPAQSLNSLKKELELWENRAQELNELGRYEEQNACLKKAIALAEKVNAIQEEQYAIKKEQYRLLSQGKEFLDLKRYEEAIKKYEQFIKIEPEQSAFAWYMKACCYALLAHVLLFVPVQKNIDLAIENLRQAIKLDPDYRERAKTNSDFDRIRQHPQFKALIDS